MSTFRVYYKVPANDRHGGYQSETMIEAADKIGAVARFMADWPSAYKVLCIIRSSVT